MRSLGLLVVVGFVSCESKVCDNERRVELLLSHDGSANYGSMFGSVSNNPQEFLDLLAEEWGPSGIRIGVSAFVDKTIPFRGWGDCCGVGEMDYCYMHHSAVSGELEDLKHAFGELSYYVGSGGDYIDSPYEGMLGAALDPRNVMKEPGLDADGKEVFRIMIVATQGVVHNPGEAESGIKRWNTNENFLTELVYWNPEFHKTGGIYNRDPQHDLDVEYPRMQELYMKGYDSLSAAEKKEFDGLYGWFGPDKFAEVMAHPGTMAAVEDCNRYEYPSVELVVQTLTERQITPHFIMGTTDVIIQQPKDICKELGHDIGNDKAKYRECLKDYYVDQFRKGGFPEDQPITVLTYDQGNPQTYTDLAEKILEILRPLSKPILCVPVEPTQPPFPPEETVTRPTKTPAIPEDTVPRPTKTPAIPEDTVPRPTKTPAIPEDTVPRPTKTPAIPEETVPRPTKTPAVPEDTVPRPSKVPITTTTTTLGGGEEITTAGIMTPVGEITTGGIMTPVAPEPVTTTLGGGGIFPTLPGGGNGGDTTTTTTTTEEEDGGSNIGLIAGATGGSLAGLAAIGLLAYKKLGGALMGGGGHPNLAQDTEQVEVDESPVERETLEEVTMDMFQ